MKRLTLVIWPPIICSKGLEKQVNESVKKGARVEIGGPVFAHLGGATPSKLGYFYPPTILSNVKPSMPAHHEELFWSKVASVIVADDADDAIRIANDTSFWFGCFDLNQGY